MIDIVRRLIAAAGQDVEPDIRGAGKPRAEIDRQFLDATAIRTELGWEPRFRPRRRAWPAPTPGTRATWSAARPTPLAT